MLIWLKDIQSKIWIHKLFLIKPQLRPTLTFYFLFILTKVALIESLKNLTLLQVKKSSAAAWRKHRLNEKMLCCSFFCALFFCVLNFHEFLDELMPPFISCLKLNTLKLKTDDVWKEYQECAVPGSNVVEVSGAENPPSTGSLVPKDWKRIRYTIITHDEQHCPWTVNVEILLFLSFRNLKFTRCGYKRLLDSECRVSCPCG